jgi:hypothetical protein
VLGWLASRVPLYLISTGHLWRWYGLRSLGDVNTYHKWVEFSLSHGVLPTDNSWQYPPLVGPLLLLPRVVPGSDYHQQFVKLAFVADAIGMLTLLWTARRRGSWLGPWFWILSVPFLGPLIYGRFDVYSALFVVAALAVLGKGVLLSEGEAGGDVKSDGDSDVEGDVDGDGTRSAADEPGGRPELNSRRWVAGVLVGLGAAVKVWPGLTVFGLPRSRRGWQTIAAAAVAAGVATVVCMLAFTNGTWFLHTQGSRGIEIESVWAVPLLLARRAHLWHATVRNHYGSIEIIGHGVGLVEKVALLSTVLVFALLAWWWWRKAWRPAVVADATLVATLLMIVTSRVISPQYLIWLLATAAFCLLSADTSQRRSALLILISLPITQWIFPYNFNSLRQADLGPMIVLIVRDVLLVAAAVIGFRDLWRDTVTGPVWPRRRSSKAAASAQNAEPAPDATTV